MSPYVRSALIAASLITLLFLTGCGATGSASAAAATTTNNAGGASSAAHVTAVTVSPSSVTLGAGQSQTFTATVTGASNTQVTWQVNGVTAGSATTGTINSSGIYTAPATVPTSSVSVTAVSVADPTKYAGALVNFTQPPPTIAVTVAPLTVILAAGQTQSFAATVTGTSNTQVSWLVNGISGGSAAVGTITAVGLYIAPASVPSSPVSISAVSAADSTKSGSATVSFSVQTAGANYYVSASGNDGNNGSQQSPWATIQHAANVAAAGATVHVAPGTYSGAITTQTSGTATARIRFLSDTQWGAVIRASSVDIIWTNQGDYVDIEGFDIAGNDGATCYGIINYASYVRIIGNNIHDLSHDTTACVYGSGIDNHNNNGGHDDDVIGNVVHDVGDINTTYQFHHGIYHANLRGHIWNNLVYRCEGWGIHTWHAANQVTISNNTVFNNNYGGILIGDGDDYSPFPGPVVNDYTIVSNNIVYSNGLNPAASGYGIEEYGLTGTHNQYLNNLVYQNGPADWNLQNGNTALGTINATPQFVNYQADGSGNYHLQPVSPAIGAGSNLGAPTIDMTGASRPSVSPDLGIYQSNSTPAGWPYIQ